MMNIESMTTNDLIDLWHELQHRLSRVADEQAATSSLAMQLLYASSELGKRGYRLNHNRQWRPSEGKT